MSDKRVFFVLPEESQVSYLMMDAYETCKHKVTNISWITETDLEQTTLGERDYIVFEHFDGRNFDNLIAMKCTIVGPLAILVCFREIKPIPSFEWPILNVVLYSREVTCSQLSKVVQKSICDKVRLMGGLYNNTFTKSITHLVCGGTKSEEYRLATQQGVKIMLPSWIDYLYEVSLSSHLNPDDPEIVEKYKCPPFYQLTICSTGIGSKNKRLERVVTENGGTYAAKLVLAKTDILVCGDSSSTTSDKLKAVRKSRRVVCVTLNWIYDSIKAGYSLPFENYIMKVATSTPTKDGENIDPNFSTLSTISTIVQNPLKMSVINETNNVGELSLFDSPSALKITNKNERIIEKLVEALDLKKFKNVSSTCLSGCTILVGGFPAPLRNKLNKIIDLSGATRYDTFSSRVSHVIIDDLTCPEVETIKSKGTDCFVVNVHWLLDSIELKKRAKEQKYIINLDFDNNTSYLKPKALNFLKDRGDDTTLNSVSNNEEDTLAKLLKGQNHDLLTEVGRENNFKPNSSSTQNTHLSDVEQIFNNLTFHLDGFNQETTEKLTESIVEFYGEIVDTDTCHYAIYPVIWNAKEHAANQKVVNDIWLSQCLEHGVLQDASNYYYAVVKQPDSAPLSNCVLSVTNYSLPERLFLKTIIESMGGIYQEQLLRRPLPDKQLLTSTHLICSEAKGKKYEAAKKWNIPAVTKDWLLDCLQSDNLKPFDDYLVSEALPSSSDDSERSFELIRRSIPFNKNEFYNANTPESQQKNHICQVTPINQIIQEVIKDNILQTPSTPESTYPWTVKTPDTPLGHFIRANPSPDLRKEMQRYVNSYPEFVPPTRRLSTPLSELKQRLWQKCFGQETFTPNDDNLKISETDEQVKDNMDDSTLLDSQINKNEFADSKLTSDQSDCEIPDTQDPAEKIFMLSAILPEEREQLAKDLEEMGAKMSTSSVYDPSVTHLICPKPGKNEKALASMASGKWILHVSYIEKSKKAGRFLNEEEFEFGNPKARNKQFYDPKDSYVYHWRRKISERGYGAFHDMRAIVVAEKRNALINVIEAGGGVVIDSEPPYKDTVDATHCLMELKMIKNVSQYVPLAQQGIKCYNIFYISHHLLNAENRNEDFKDFIIPHFSNYYH